MHVLLKVHFMAAQVEKTIFYEATSFSGHSICKVHLNRVNKTNAENVE